MGAAPLTRLERALADAADSLAKGQGTDLGGSNGNVPGVVDTGDLADAGLQRPGPQRPPGTAPTVEQIDDGRFCVISGDHIGPCFDTAAEAMQALARVEREHHDKEMRMQANPEQLPERGLVVPSDLVAGMVDGSVGLVVAPERFDIEGKRVALVVGDEAVATAVVGKVEQIADDDFVERQAEHGIAPDLRASLAKSDPLWAESPLFGWPLEQVAKFDDGVPVRTHGEGLLVEVEVAPPIVVWKADPPDIELPGIKTPHASLLVDRLMAGQSAGLLALRNADERVGAPQVLLDDAGHVFAVVTQRAPQRFDDIDAVPSELRAGIDPSVLDEFVGKAGVWFLPLDIEVAFDPHIELPNAPDGGLFVAGVQLGKAEITDDPVQFVATCDEMKLAAADDETLRTFDRQLHVLFERNFAPDAQPEAKLDLTVEQVIAAHVMVLRAMTARGLQTPEDDGLAQLTAEALDKADAAGVTKVVRERKNPETGATEFCVIGEESERNFGCFPTREQANERLRQIESFSDDPGAHDMAKSARDVRLLKQDGSEPEERYVFGVVLVPDDVDAQGDVYDTKAVRDAAHGFMEHFGGRIKLMHKGQPVQGVKVLETYLTKVEETHGGETFPIGTWLMGVRVQSDELWAAVKAGEFTGFSIGGTAIREALN